jgi:hypothetical protein
MPDLLKTSPKFHDVQSLMENDARLVQLLRFA